jgi:hypothetical protein
VTLSVSSTQPDLLATVGNAAGKRTGTIWRMPQVPVSPESNRGGSFGPPAVDMVRLCDIASTSELQHLQWFPASDTGDSGQLLSADDNAAQVSLVTPYGSLPPVIPAPVAVSPPPHARTRTPPPTPPRTQLKPTHALTTRLPSRPSGLATETWLGDC